jgi:molecular chaperone DnaK (HSP70)
MFLGRRALIGQRALDRNRDVALPAFAPTFKAALASEATRPLARVGRRQLSAREVAGLFLRELLAETKRATGHRIRDLVVTSPVSAFETYRAEVQRLLADLGVRRVRFVDEPLAAALGYGLSLSHERCVLVVDIGGGTMHVALVELSPRGSLGGEARVLAKQGRPLGGNAVDGWLLEAACAKAGLPSLDVLGDESARFWRRVMLAEACRVKEALHFEDSAVFRVTPPAPSRAAPSLLSFTRAELVAVLEANGFYRGLESCLAAMFEDGRAKASDVDDVLVVGGSTLLPGVHARIEQHVEKRRLRAWQPFEAVAYGGACFAATASAPSTSSSTTTLRHARREDGRRAAHGDRSARDALPHAARSLEAAARAHLLARRAGGGVPARDLRDRARKRRRPAFRLGRGGRPPQGRRRRRQGRADRAAQRREPDARLSRPAARAAGPAPAARDRLRRQRRALAGRDGARPDDARGADARGAVVRLI